MRRVCALDPNAVDEYGRTPLEWAIREDKPQAIETLVRLGANPNTLNKYGENLVHNAISMNKPQLIEPLIKCGTDLNVYNKGGLTPLHKAISIGQIQGIESLIECGAKLDITTADGQSPIQYAVTQNKPHIVKMLIDHGVDPNRYPDLLHNAVKSRNTKMIDILLEKFDSLDIKDAEGKTLLQNAMDKGDHSTIKKILSKNNAMNITGLTKKEPSSLSIHINNLKPQSISKKTQQSR